MVEPIIISDMECVTINNIKEVLDLAFPNQNNQQKEQHVNTRGIQLFNVNGFEGSTLIISMWNQMVALRIHPAKEKSQQTKTSVYDYDKSVSIVLDNKTAQLIADVILEEVLPATQEGKECTKGIPVGSNSAVIVSTGVKRSSGKIMPYVGIARNIKPGTLLPEEMLSYTFNLMTILDNYDGNPGNQDFNPQTCQRAYHAELVMFAHALKHLAVAMIGGEYHAGRNINKRYDDNVFQLYKQLAAKNGIEFYSGNGNGGYQRGSGNVFGNGGGQTFNASTNFNSTLDTKPEEVGSISELDLDAFA